MKRFTILAPMMALAAACQQPAFAAEKTVRAPAAETFVREDGGLKTAIFAGGCFWGVEGVFSHMKGVKSVISGYHGGGKDTASYSKIGSGDTGHAEAVKVTYDPSLVRYDQLLRVFFSVINDPTQLNRQGPDVGSQYRSALVPLNAAQRKVAASYLKELQSSGVWGGRIVTKIESPKTFYPAEAYHQDFMKKNPSHPYIQRWDKPKLEALRSMYPGYYSASYAG